MWADAAPASQHLLTSAAWFPPRAASSSLLDDGAAPLTYTRLIVSDS